MFSTFLYFQFSVLINLRKKTQMLNCFGTGFILWFIDIKRTSIFPITRFELSNKRTLLVCHALFLLTGRLSPAAIAWKGFTSHLSFLCWVLYHAPSCLWLVSPLIPYLQWKNRFCLFSFSVIFTLQMLSVWFLRLTKSPLSVIIVANSIFPLFRILIVPWAQKETPDCPSVCLPQSPL